MDSDHSPALRELLSLRNSQSEFCEETAEASSVQAVQEPLRHRMTATCIACGEPCRCGQWFAGGGAFACSLGCLEGRS